MKLVSALLALGAVLPSARVSADEAADLSRTTPVPATQPIPVIDFFRPAMLDEPRLNPSGTHVAAIVAGGDDRHQLLVYNLKTLTKEVLGGQGDSDVYQVNWLNDTRLVFQLSSQKLYGIGLFATEVGSIGNCYPLQQYQGSRLVSVPSDDRVHPLVWNAFDSLRTQGDLGVSSIDTDVQSFGKAVDLLSLRSNSLEALSALRNAQENNQRHILHTYPMPGPGHVTGYAADKDGHLEYAFVTHGRERSLYRFFAGSWAKCPVNLETTAVIGAGNQPGQLVAVGGALDGKPRPLRFLDAASGEFGQVLLADKDYDFNGWVYRDPISHDILGATTVLSGPHVVWFSDVYKNLQKMLNGFFPNTYVQLIGSNERQNLFLVGSSSDRQPVTYSWVNLETRQAGLIAKSRPWIDPDRMQPMGAIKFKTRDGHLLDAYLTLPKGATAKTPAPMVVLAHGGPWLRDRWGFNGEVQFLASRGYAVLQPNYRGSPGTVWMVKPGEDWDFLKMHEDVSDATRGAISTHLVDPSRIAIMGGSFGGYLALQGLVNEPSLYRCAIAIAGVFDWEDFLNEKKANIEHFGDASFDLFLIREGDPSTHRERFDAISPARHIDRVHAPVFVSHGGYDTIADIGQSKRLVSELEKHGVPHETYFVLTETQGMHHLVNQVGLYSRIEAFLAKNLAPQAPAAKAP